MRNKKEFDSGTFRYKVTMIFIAHQLPKGLHVDSVITLGPHETCMQVVASEREDG